MTTNMREKGLEDQVVAWLVEMNGYELGSMDDYNRKVALDETRLRGNPYPLQVTRLAVRCGTDSPRARR